MRAVFITAVLVALLCSSCLLTWQDDSNETVLRGKWGGDHISMEVEVDGTKIEYDCAHATIDEPLVLDSRSMFEAVRIHVFEHGGPIQQDEVPDVHPALYRGNVRGSTMSMSVTITDMKMPTITYVLERGTTGRIFKCL